MRIHRIYGLISPRFFEKRKREFHRIMRPRKDDRILDVGGTPWFWRSMDCEAHVTCLNIEAFAVTDSDYQRITYIQGDGRNLPFQDKQFDIVFSNAVLPHVGTFHDQRRFAAEVRRVGKAYWVEAAHRWFVMDPTLLTPFVHFLPVRWQRRLVRRFTVWGVLSRPSDQEIEHVLATTHLLIAKELSSLFPDSTLLHEHFLLLTKSMIAYHVGDRPRAADRGA